MEYKRDVRGMSRRKKVNNVQRTLKGVSKKLRPVHWLFIIIGLLCFMVVLYFATDKFSNPEVDVLSTDIITNQHTKHLVVVENSATKDKEVTSIPSQQPSQGQTGNGKSGILFGDYPGELFAVSMTGEGSGGGEGLIGDGGRAYGLMQLDYRYALVPYCQWAVQQYPDLWGGLAPFTNVAGGSASLRNNMTILGVFESARVKDPKAFVATQCEYFKNTFYDDTYTKLKAQGIDLDERHIAVSAAILSLNVNCGSQTSKICGLINSSMSDEEIIRLLYANRRNGYLKQGDADANRWKEENEVAQCLALLNGTWTIDQDYPSATSYSGGWFWSKLEPIYFK